MNKLQLTRLFARVSRRSPARAADEIDNLVYKLLKEIKRQALRPLTQQRSSAAGSAGGKQER